jgi:hypothetical protein
MKTFKILFYLLTLLEVSTYAEIALKGEILFLKPMSDHTWFANEIEESATTTIITKKEDDTRYRPGFRLAALWQCACGHDLQARYTHLSSGYYTSRIDGNYTTIDLLGLIGPATSQVKFNYNCAEALFGNWIYANRSFDLDFEFGLQYANIQTNFKTFYGPFPGIGIRSDLIQRRNHFWGIGPEVAFDFHYVFCSCGVGNFGLTGYSRGALLCSRSHSSGSTTRTSTRVFEIFYDADPKWRVIPTADLRLGFDWGYGCDCFKGSLEVGYEWLWYQKVNRELIQSGTSKYSDISFQGPYLSVAVIF